MVTAESSAVGRTQRTLLTGGAQLCALLFLLPIEGDYFPFIRLMPKYIWNCRKCSLYNKHNKYIVFDYNDSLWKMVNLTDEIDFDESEKLADLLK